VIVFFKTFVTFVVFFRVTFVSGFSYIHSSKRDNYVYLYTLQNANVHGKRTNTYVDIHSACELQNHHGPLSLSPKSFSVSEKSFHWYFIVLACYYIVFLFDASVGILFSNIFIIPMYFEIHGDDNGCDCNFVRVWASSECKIWMHYLCIKCIFRTWITASHLLAMVSS